MRATIPPVRTTITTMTTTIALNLIPLYELSNDGIEVTATSGPQSSKLPLYEAIVKNTTLSTIIDSGATTYYLSEKRARNLGLQVQKVTSRRIRVADKIWLNRK